ncbi:MAG TPA: hypothetical protein VMU14_03995, partial [Acidimicrobiales bacterium]|nr:hypothetical protein [Acidimicrobiales bacterium]
FARTDALVGLPPRPGGTLLFENDRVRVLETALAPGESDAPRVRGDHATFVIDGGRVQVVAFDDDREREGAVQERPSTSAAWAVGRGPSRLVNVGTTPYRELTVELK